MERKCTYPSCGRKYRSLGYCSLHYDRLRAYGDPSVCKYADNGKGCISHGYRVMTVNGKQVPEHRIVLEKKLGRKLKPWPKEVGHHINGNRLDNRPENLEVMTLSDHISHHFLKSVIKGNLKICSKCEKWLPILRFGNHKNGKYGLRSNCKDCESILSPRRRSVIRADLNIT